EGLVAVEDAVPTRQQVALEPALALVLGEHFDDASFWGLVLVGRQPGGHPLPVGHLEDGAQAVRLRLVGAEDAEARRVAAYDVPQPDAEDARRLAERRAGSGDLDGVIAEVRDGEVAEELAAVRVRVRAHPARPPRGKLGQLRHEAAVLAEELLGAVAAQPL